MNTIFDNYLQHFGTPAEKEFTVYGRAELGGNHTDHQHGLVIASTVDRAMHAAAAKNGSSRIRICSEGFGEISFEADNLGVKKAEVGTTTALIRGVASKYRDKVSGFNAFITSDIPVGSGLSSSACFEVLIARIIENLFDCPQDPTTTAINAQYAENVYYGKPCGLMDQMSCSYGGIVKIDFGSTIPKVESLDFDFEKAGYTFCIIDSGTSHADLTDSYSEITLELAKISNYFYQDNLSQVDKRQFAAQISELRKYAGDRAVMRAMHVFNENFRVEQMAKCLKEGNVDEYLALVNRSGDSSWMLLQNVIPAGSIQNQGLALAITSAKLFLGGKGACRVMGGGFAGSLQAYVPSEDLPKFILNMERTLGRGCCRPTKLTHY